MASPWLEIPLDDYEAHMALATVGQAQMLASVFATLLAQEAPRSVAVVGCAGGNGFERIDPAVTTRVVGIDINPAYLAEARTRFATRLPGLELHAVDVEQDLSAIAPCDLLYAGLLLEYVDPDRTLIALRPLLAAEGVLVTVVQLPNFEQPRVTPSPYTSLAALAPVLRLVPPDWLHALAALRGYRLRDQHDVHVAGGKSFCVQVFARGPDPE
jgi:SAM-dependent methyltransferase